ncbi:hypothetical protein [Bartonella quintana]|uniref:hypothetical protein n=1 Tax=Bartonella quintana TaxID=803 RepID=UPI00027FCB80|nr:hypothetical protein [Bartonella quintana]AFR26459.1 hypothetical protein RM11_0738 [Bartonella quintana RM-11]
MEKKIIELSAVDQETACLLPLRKEMDACRKVFKMKLADSFSRQIVGIFVGTLDNFSQQNLAELKKLLGKAGKKERICRATFENPISSLLLTHILSLTR